MSTEQSESEFWAELNEVIDPASSSLRESIDRLVNQYEVSEEDASLYCMRALADNLGMSESFQQETEAEEYLTPSDVAKWFKVSPKSVTRWAEQGKIPYMKTLGGHRRFRLSEVAAAFEEFNTTD